VLITPDLEARDVLAEAAHLVVVDLALGRAPTGAGGGAPGLQVVPEGPAAPLGGEAVVVEQLTAAVLRGREEHLQHAPHRQAVVLHGVRRRLRGQLARVDQPAEGPPLLLARARMRLHAIDRS
jgi:hypothetical protein